MKAKVLEIFSSIQGEGKYAGVKQVFVRFFECNMHCTWCDTPHSIGDTTRQFDEYSLDELMAKVRHLWKEDHSVSITGGEPLVQAEFLQSFLPRLQQQHMPVYLETNGVLPQELSKVIDSVDIIAMDMKLPSSTKCRAYWKEHEDFLRIAVASRKDVFVKTVITSDTEKDDLHQAVNIIRKIDPNILLILQPNYFEMKNGVVRKCAMFQGMCSSDLPNVRILPQIHKFMKLR